MLRRLKLAALVCFAVLGVAVAVVWHWVRVDHSYPSAQETYFIAKVLGWKVPAEHRDFEQMVARNPLPVVQLLAHDSRRVRRWAELILTHFSGPDGLNDDLLNLISAELKEKTNSDFGYNQSALIRILGSAGERGAKRLALLYRSRQPVEPIFHLEICVQVTRGVSRQELVDALLDVAASGVNTVERDGISSQHAARFVLVGTMNPEEGELRPQLLDRFGLSVALVNPTDAALRMAIVRARLGFDEQPDAWVEQHAGEQARLVDAVAAARAALPRLAWSDEVLHHAAACALAAGVDGMRADLVMLRAARALAAFEGRDTVTTHDVDAVAELALAHRRGDGARAPAMPPASPLPAPPAQSPDQKAGQPAGRPADGLQSAPSKAPGRTDHSPRDPVRDPAAIDGLPPGDWGALPPRPATTVRVVNVGGWPSKKA